MTSSGCKMQLKESDYGYLIVWIFLGVDIAFGGATISLFD